MTKAINDNPFRPLSAREVLASKSYSCGGRPLTPQQALASTRTSYRAGLIRSKRARKVKPEKEMDDDQRAD